MLDGFSPRAVPATVQRVRNPASAVLGALLLLPLLTACGGDELDRPAAAAAPSPKPLVVLGSVDLGHSEFGWNRDPLACWGSGGYGDLKTGAQVVVTDAAGATIAVGSIIKSNPGTSWVEETDTYRADSCTLDFRVADVPPGKGFYGVEVTHRGQVQYAENDLLRPLVLTI